METELLGLHYNLSSTESLQTHKGSLSVIAFVNPTLNALKTFLDNTVEIEVTASGILLNSIEE